MNQSQNYDTHHTIPYNAGIAAKTNLQTETMENLSIEELAQKLVENYDRDQLTILLITIKKLSDEQSK